MPAGMTMQIAERIGLEPREGRRRIAEHVDRRR
jgi:hypothetical protein